MPSDIPSLERLPAVLKRTGLSRSALYAAIARGDFPSPVKLGARAIGFHSCKIDDWIANRPGAR